MKRSELVISTFLFFLASSLFFYNFSWGEPFFFHPDERNIAYGVTALQFPSEMNPHFFAYGSLPIYTIYFLAITKNFLLNGLSSTTIVSLSDAILVARMLSASFALLLIPLFFKIGTILKNKLAGILASVFGILSVGIIQYAHFGTFELWLTFFYTVLFLRFLIFLENKSARNLLALSIVTGILFSIKLSSIVLILVPLLSIYFFAVPIKKNYGILIKQLALSAITILLLFFATNPYTLLDFSSFLNSITYESQVATGKLPVFYTEGFQKTIPLLYQITEVYPFILNPIMFLLVFPAVIFLSYKHRTNKKYISCLLFFFLYFFSQSFLFVKWTRYLIPTLPFLYFLLALFIAEIRAKKIIFYCMLILSLSVSIIWSSAYVLTVLYPTDTRITAFEWAKQNIPPTKNLLAESYDLGVLPFTSYFTSFTVYNFYDLDTNPSTYELLEKELRNYDYLVLPSQRVMRTRLKNRTDFPIGYTFYTRLSTDPLFQKVYETPCDFFCTLLYLGNPTSRFEETSNVFDRPTVRIFRITN